MRPSPLLPGTGTRRLRGGGAGSPRPIADDALATQALLRELRRELSGLNQVIGQLTSEVTTLREGVEALAKRTSEAAARPADEALAARVAKLERRVRKLRRAAAKG